MIQPHSGDKRFIRRTAWGQFTDRQVDLGKSLSRDKQSTAKHTGAIVGINAKRPRAQDSKLLLRFNASFKACRVGALGGLSII
jgi:hypothetical protein